MEQPQTKEQGSTRTVERGTQPTREEVQRMNKERGTSTEPHEPNTDDNSNS